SSEFFSALEHVVREDHSHVLLEKINNILQNNPKFLSENSNHIKKILASVFNITQLSPADRALAFRIFNMMNPAEFATDSKIVPHWKDSPQSRWEIQQFRIALSKDPEFTQNFEFVTIPGNTNSYLGRGREGIVFLARQKTNGKLMAIKARCEREPEVH